MPKSRAFLLFFFYVLLQVYYICTVEQNDFISILFYFVGASILCYLFYRFTSFSKHGLGLLIFGLVLRVILIFESPALSDDYYRYYWDAWLIEHSQDPYSTPPNELYNKTIKAPQNDPISEVYQKLNSPEYNSVYPLGSQIIFSFAYYLSGTDLNMFPLVLCIIFLFFEGLLILSCLKLLEYLNANKQQILLLIFNPFFIVEFVGNLHLDLIFVSLMFLGLVQLIKARTILSGLLLSLSLSIKPQAIIFIPFMVLLSKDFVYALKLSGTIALGTMLMYVPIVYFNSLSGFSEGLELYFKRFEFNASLYYFFRWLGYKSTGYNQIAVIGPWMSAAIAVSLIVIWIRGFLLALRGIFTLEQALKLMSWSFIIYLLLSTTVHPWYILPLLIIGILLDKLWLIVWSGVIFLSYSFYDEIFETWSFVLSLLSYLPVVLFALNELFNQESKRNSLKLS